MKSAQTICIFLMRGANRNNAESLRVREAGERLFSQTLSFEVEKGFESLLALIESFVKAGKESFVLVGARELSVKYRRTLLPEWFQKIRASYLTVDFHFSGTVDPGSSARKKEAK